VHPSILPGMTAQAEPTGQTSTVIVPTRDRPASLARCLEALDVQEGTRDLEVLVVGDGSVSADEVAA